MLVLNCGLGDLKLFIRVVCVIDFVREILGLGSELKEMIFGFYKILEDINFGKCRYFKKF